MINRLTLIQKKPKILFLQFRQVRGKEVKMIRQILVFLGILILFVAPIILAENQKKEVSLDEVMKYFCKTWINPAYYEDPWKTGIQTFNKDGTWEMYKNETSKSPMYFGIYKIEKSWIDKDSNVWLHVIWDERILKKYVLIKISEDGNTLEFAYDYRAYPTVDPETWPDAIMRKK